MEISENSLLFLLTNQETKITRLSDEVDKNSVRFVYLFETWNLINKIPEVSKESNGRKGSEGLMILKKMVTTKI